MVDNPERLKYNRHMRPMLKRELRLNTG